MRPATSTALLTAAFTAVVLAGCASRRVARASRDVVAVPPAPAVPAPRVEAPTDARTFAPWDGAYELEGVDGGAERSLAWVRTLSAGPSLILFQHVLAGGGPDGDGAYSFELTEDGHDLRLRLAPSARGGGAWRISVPGDGPRWAQRVDPLEARLRDRLLAGQRFVRVDLGHVEDRTRIDEALSHDTLTVLPRGLVRFEMPDSPRSASCFVDALAPADDTLHVPASTPVPAAGALGHVVYGLAKVGSDCDSPDLDAPAHGSDGAAFVFVATDGHPAGVLLVAYMTSDVFVGPGCTRAELDAMMNDARRALEHQAE